MILDLGLVAVGLVALTLGADFLVRGVVTLSLQLGLSTTLVSLTVVAFGTSLPEFFVVLKSMMADAPGIGMGNIVGSNIANLCLILAACALIRPLAVNGAILRRDGLAMLAASCLFALIAWQGPIGVYSGGLFLALLLGYLTLCVLRDGPQDEAASDALNGPTWRVWCAVIGGLAGLLVGSDLLVSGGVSIARDAGVDEAVIGLTLVALGTSLPELATCVAAIIRRRADVVLGNILGSNIFNLLGVLGLASMIAPLTLPAQILSFDLQVMIAVTLGVLFLLRTGWRLDRWEGGVLLSVYVSYVAVQFGPLSVGTPAANLAALP